MGLRLHKSMGWLTTHPHPERLRDRLYEGERTGEVEAFVRNLIAERRRQDQDTIRLLIEAPMRNVPGKYPTWFNQVVHQVCGPDYEGSDWIVSPPAFALEWHRRDDGMDHYARKAQPDWMCHQVIMLDHAPYPYEKQTEDGTPEIIAALARHLGFDEGNLRPALAIYWT